MADILLITPGSGVQNMDSGELNETLAAIAAGGTLTSAQQAMANSLQTPTQGNIFASGGADESSVKDVAATGGDTPVVPLPTTTSGGTSQASKDIQGFLSGLRPSETGQALGGPQPTLDVSGQPFGGAFDLASLQGQLFGGQQTQGNAPTQPGLATIGDVDKIERNENLLLDADFFDLERRRSNQILSDQVRRGVIPAAARVTNRLGKSIVDLEAIGLTQDQVDATKKRAPKPFANVRRSIIGAPRPSSIIGR